ncbi:MAG: L-ribulose-5-phosphate 4-epimerase AraD [Mycoplasma sp.]|nr:L-ribulose-5-phosphate 4-epimerase AraD [Mycoplasma sp.]
MHKIFDLEQEKKIKLLQKQVYEANLLLKEYQLVIHTWGNVSAITKDRKYIIIKPSGLEYKDLSPEKMVIVDRKLNVINSRLKPSTDTETHLQLYKSEKTINAICHTHSTYATSFCQAGKEIICYGTTHADNFYQNIPITRALNKKEITTNYELNTGKVIIEHFKNKDLSLKKTNAVLVREHGPFIWSFKNAKDVVDLALTLEQIAKMNINCLIINPNIKGINQFLKDKHYQRKHGKDKYYGQN